MVAKEILEMADGDVQAAIYALEDGNFLEQTTYTQQQVEIAHAELTALGID